MASLKEASKRNRMHFRNFTDRTPFRNRSRSLMSETGVSPTALHCQWGGGTDNTASTFCPRMIVGAPCCKRTRGHNTSMRRAVPTTASVQSSHLQGCWSALPTNSGDITARRPHGRAPNPGLCCDRGAVHTYTGCPTTPAKVTPSRSHWASNNARSSSPKTTALSASH